jgi:hypothetical protein
MENMEQTQVECAQNNAPMTPKVRAKYRSQVAREMLLIEREERR